MKSLIKVRDSNLSNTFYLVSKHNQNQNSKRTILNVCLYLEQILDRVIYTHIYTGKEKLSLQNQPQFKNNFAFIFYFKHYQYQLYASSKTYICEKIKIINIWPANVVLSNVRQTYTRIWHSITTSILFKKNCWFSCWQCALTSPICERKIS